MAAASPLHPTRLLAALAVLASMPQPVMGEAEMPSGLVTCWDYLPPYAQGGITHAAAQTATMLHHAVSVGWFDRAPPAPLPVTALRSATALPGSTVSIGPTVSIGDAGLTGAGGPTMPPSTGPDSITGASRAADSTSGDSTSADLGFFATTSLTLESDSVAARRYRAAATPGRIRIYGIMTPEIAREMLERADRFPGESPKGMPLAEVLAHNQLPKATRVSPGHWVADGTRVVGTPQSGG